MFFLIQLFFDLFRQDFLCSHCKLTYIIFSLRILDAKSFCFMLSELSQCPVSLACGTVKHNYTSQHLHHDLVRQNHFYWLVVSAGGWTDSFTSLKQVWLHQALFNLELNVGIDAVFASPLCTFWTLKDQTVIRHK